MASGSRPRCSCNRDCSENGVEFMADNRVYIRKLIDEQKTVIANATAEKRRLEEIYAKHEGELGLVWAIKWRHSPSMHYWASISKHDAFQVWASSNVVQLGSDIVEYSIEEAKRLGLTINGLKAATTSTKQADSKPDRRE